MGLDLANDLSAQEPDAREGADLVLKSIDILPRRGYPVFLKRLFDEGHFTARHTGRR